jgi:selenocysteine lyase/cysteine desulfurase
MQVRAFSEGDYRVVEVYDEEGKMLIRVGFDHEPTQDEIDALLQSVEGGENEWQP